MFVQNIILFSFVGRKWIQNYAFLPSLKLMIKIFVFVLVHTVVQEKRERIAKKFGKMR